MFLGEGNCKRNYGVTWKSWKKFQVRLKISVLQIFRVWMEDDDYWWLEWKAKETRMNTGNIHHRNVTWRSEIKSSTLHRWKSEKAVRRFRYPLCPRPWRTQNFWTRVSSLTAFLAFHSKSFRIYRCYPCAICSDPASLSLGNVACSTRKSWKFKMAAMTE